MTRTKQDIGTDPAAPYIGGTTAEIVVTVTRDGSPWSMADAQAVTWKAYNGETGPPIISKSLDAGVALDPDADHKLVITLDGSDTANLHGLYVHRTDVVDAEGRAWCVAIGHLRVRGIPKPA